MRQVAPLPSLPLSLWQNKRLPCCWGVSDQHNVYFTIQLKVIQLTNYLRSARALQKEATRRDAGKASATATTTAVTATATATATAVRILHTYKASAAAAAAVQPAATTATVAVAVAAVQSASICVDHL